jgi:copper resistance protein C
MQPSRPGRALPVLLLLLALAAVAFPATVAAHAELASTSPADEAILQAPPTEIVAVFTEALNPDRSVMDLLQGSSVLASSGPNPADPTRIVLSDLALEAGEYQVRWTAAGTDGHIERGIFTFTVLEPTPTPATTPTPPTAPTADVPSPTPAPVVTPEPTPTAAPTPNPGGSPAGGEEALVPIVAMLAVVGLLGLFLLRRRGRAA